MTVSRGAEAVHNGVVLTGEWDDDDAMWYADSEAAGS
jgi:hypothetical protein